MSEIDEAVGVLKPADHILVFTGAGISTESGIPDFRGPDGLWKKMDPDEFHIDYYLATPERRIKGWQMHLAGELWGARSSVQPNQGHHAIASLSSYGRLAGVVTQNVDGLHIKSGLDIDQVAELHGNVRRCVCYSCGSRWPTEEVLSWVEAGEPDPSCRECGGVVKTTTVMFGEMLPEEEMRKANLFLAVADAVIVVGSTVSVWPAAEIVFAAARRPIPIVIVNEGATEADHLAAVKIESAIGDSLPAMVKGIVA